jgi:hypothetical protein
MEPETIRRIIAVAEARRNEALRAYASALWRLALKALRAALRALRRNEHLDYLAAAIDHADLERRLRAIERGARRPHFVTFNH